MRHFILLAVLVFLLPAVLGRAVSKTVEQKAEESDKHEDSQDVANALEYERYLREVVNALETDPEFRKKLDNATDVDIRSGKIAHELEYVNHNVRTQLDEIKRREMERLRLAAIRHYELMNDIDRDHLKIQSQGAHIDHENPHTFEIEDLKKLIKKTSDDLAEADKKRREEFKEYELQKEFEKQEKLRIMDEEHRKQYEEDLKVQHQKHNQHERVHHPGNKKQLEEVWEKQDHMDPADFNPKTFFMMHDTDGNNFWDETEVKALFIKELDKVYQSGLPEDDMRERAEEMERMREHVFREADTNHDNLISLEEFIAQTKREEFNRDPGWETVDNQPQFTHEEYLEFERRRQEEIQRLIAQGALPPHPNMPQGYYPNQHQPQYHYQGQPGGYPQHQPVQLHPNQVYNHVPDPNAHYQNAQQMHPNQINAGYPQGNIQYGNMPAHHGNIEYQPHYQSGNVPVNQAGVPVQAHPNQINAQQAPNAVPQQQPIANNTLSGQNQANLNQQPNVQYQNQQQQQQYPNQANSQYQQVNQGQIPIARPNQVKPQQNQPSAPQQQQKQAQFQQAPNMNAVPNAIPNAGKVGEKNA